MYVIGALLGCDRGSTPSHNDPPSLPSTGDENAIKPTPNPIVRNELKDGPASHVAADRQLVTLRSASGKTEVVRWSDLRQISVITTDEGPRLTDVFIVLEGPTSRLVIPHDAKGNEGFVSLLVTIDGFDHLTFARAMGSADNAEFVCWTGAGARFRGEPK